MSVWKLTSWSLEYVVLACLLLPVVVSLQCWQCIADDCYKPPVNNHKAVKITCLEGASCQKVEYRGRDYATLVDYVSVVRSCSQGACSPHADNCTERLLTNPGCMTRHCCKDKNLCNGEPPASACQPTLVTLSLLILVLR